MQYVSTRGSAPALDFEGATLAGLAADGGLYVPAEWPKFSVEEIEAFAGLPYPELAAKVMLPFVGHSLTEAKLRRARAYLFATAAEVWDDLARGAALTEGHRVALRLASTSTIHQSTEIVDTAYHMAGATAVFRANGFERRLRDMHAINQQLQARDTHYEEIGKVILSGNLAGPPTAR